MGRTPPTPEKRKEYRDWWKAKNPGKQAEYSRAYRERHPVRTKAAQQKYLVEVRRSPEGRLAEYFRHIRRAYGVTQEDYQSRLDEQGGVCAVCGTDQFGTRLNLPVVDHCHDTGTVRGLLCQSCNKAAGLCMDNPSTLRKLAHYLERS